MNNLILLMAVICFFTSSVFFFARYDSATPEDPNYAYSVLLRLVGFFGVVTSMFYIALRFLESIGNLLPVS